MSDGVYPESDGGYGTGLAQYSLKQLWNMVEPQDHSNGYTHPDAWRHMGELCTAMAQKLRETGAAIADRWPPERSRAAAAFRDRLELLAAAFDNAGQVGNTNAPHLFDLQITNATFRGTMSTIVDDRDQTQARAQERVDAYISSKGNVRGFAAWNSLTLDQKLAYTNMPPDQARLDAQVGPVPNDWRQGFETQAKLAAASYETDLASYKGSFAQPKPVDPTLTPSANPAAGGYQAGGGSPIGLGLWVPPPLSRPQPPIDPGPPPPGKGGDPILDQVPFPLPGSGPGGYPAHGAGIPTPGDGAPIPGAGTVPLVPIAGGRYAMAPGGVIGEPIRPTVGPTSAGAAVVRAAGPGRLMPVESTLGRTARGSFVAPPGGVIGGAPGDPGRPGGGGRRRADDDQSFTVQEGVPAVLFPPAEPDEHHPGPGVIGIDR
jgi:hypothetical protein